MSCVLLLLIIITTLFLLISSLKLQTTNHPKILVKMKLLPNVLTDFSKHLGIMKQKTNTAWKQEIVNLFRNIFSIKCKSH